MKVGDKVRKLKGYPYDGIIRAVFPTSADATRVVVELDRGNNTEGDMLHIFSPAQLEVSDENV